MRFHSFKEQESYRILFLVPQIQLNAFKKEYLPYLNKEDILLLDLYYEPKKKKNSVSVIKEYLKEVQDIVDDYKVQYIICTDADYFKVIAKVSKTDPYLGYVLPSMFKDVVVTYVPNTKAIFFNPELVRSKIKKGLEAFNAYLLGSYTEPGKGIIHKAIYPKSDKEIEEVLNKLIQLNKPLTCDIETYSLKHYDSGIASIAFALDEHSGCAFTVDDSKGNPNKIRRKLLKQFFERFSEKLMYHNIAFDVYILIYNLYMRDLLDSRGLYEGMSVLLKNWDDTKLITYLATNSCSRVELGLKAQSQEFSGNYALEEIEDITSVPTDKLLEYNLVDTLSTWYVYNKYWNKMIEDKQFDIYQTLFKPSTAAIIHKQLVGFPLDMDVVKATKKSMEEDRDKALKVIKESPIVYEWEFCNSIRVAKEKNLKYKKKEVHPADCYESFNPGSGKQIREILYDLCKLPVLDTTDSGLPATGADTLAKLKNKTEDKFILELLQALIDLVAVQKILTAFIPTFEKAVPASDGRSYLYGNFNLGGTVSGRLSSSNPNLQQIPATGSKYAKPIKRCFKAPKGWVMCGLDFSALEDHISALTTKDPNKLAVYLHNYDGHCLRAYSYFQDKMPDIEAEMSQAKTEEEKVKIINSIKDRYKSLRQISKGPTFCLTYAGTSKALQSIFGFSEKEALNIESKYHELYKVSDAWVKAHIDDAGKKGYVTGAFGLRCRTPLLYQSMRGLRCTPKEVEAEARTAGNMLGQSWCLLTNRAGNAFLKELYESPYKYDIRPIGDIHDAQYFLVKDDIDTILWLNKHLVKAVEWQDDPEIYHPEVKLGGELSIFYPDWAHEIVVPNKCDRDTLISLVST